MGVPRPPHRGRAARIRDFRGLNPRTFDGHGNFTFGLTEQLVFPEIDYDKIEKVRGMDITVVTSAETDEQGRALLTALVPVPPELTTVPDRPARPGPAGPGGSTSRWQRRH